MRVLLKVNIPTEAGNGAIKSGAIPGKLKQILDELKPEAAYFAEAGRAHGLHLSRYGRALGFGKDSRAIFSSFQRAHHFAPSDDAR